MWQTHVCQQVVVPSQDWRGKSNRQILEEMTSETSEKVSEKPNKRILCGVIALTAPLWGGFGVHKFVLGYIKAGIIQLVLTFLLVGAVISVVEGVVYLLKTDEEFYKTYQEGRRPWF